MLLRPSSRAPLDLPLKAWTETQRLRAATSPASNKMLAFYPDEGPLRRELYPKHSVVTVDREDFRVYRRNKRETIPLICPPTQ